MRTAPIKISNPAVRELKVTGMPIPAVHKSSTSGSKSQAGIAFKTTSGTSMGVPGVRVGKMG